MKATTAHTNLEKVLQSHSLKFCAIELSTMARDIIK